MEGKRFMKELMHLLGFKDKEMATDIIASVENQTFLPITSHEELQQLALQSNNDNCVYVKSSQKQVYELESNQLYTIAHQSTSQKALYVNIKKEDVIAFIKCHLADYDQNNIAIYATDECVSFADYIKQCGIYIAKEDLLIIENQAIWTVDQGENLDPNDFTNTAFIGAYPLSKNMNIDQLNPSEKYCIVINAYELGVVDAFSQLDMMEILKLVNQYIKEYAAGHLFIFNENDRLVYTDLFNHKETKTIYPSFNQVLNFLFANPTVNEEHLMQKVNAYIKHRQQQFEKQNQDNKSESLSLTKDDFELAQLLAPVFNAHRDVKECKITTLNNTPIFEIDYVA